MANNMQDFCIPVNGISCIVLQKSLCDPLEMTEDQYKRDIGRRLKIAVEVVQARDGISQAEVARRMRISAQRLGNYFRGTHYPNPYHVWLFCQRSGVTFDWIYREVVPGLPAALADSIVDMASETPLGAGGSARPARRKKQSSSTE